jgi:hypothetical protein
MALRPGHTQACVSGQTETITLPESHCPVVLEPPSRFTGDRRGIHGRLTLSSQARLGPLDPAGPRGGSLVCPCCGGGMPRIACIEHAEGIEKILAPPGLGATPVQCPLASRVPRRIFACGAQSVTRGPPPTGSRTRLVPEGGRRIPAALLPSAFPLTWPASLLDTPRQVRGAAPDRLGHGSHPGFVPGDASDQYRPPHLGLLHGGPLAHHYPGGSESTPNARR